jgi:hypothetical protein
MSEPEKITENNEHIEPEKIMIKVSDEDARKLANHVQEENLRLQEKIKAMEAEKLAEKEAKIQAIEAENLELKEKLNPIKKPHGVVTPTALNSSTPKSKWQFENENDMVKTFVKNKTDPELKKVYDRLTAESFDSMSQNNETWEMQSDLVSMLNGKGAYFVKKRSPPDSDMEDKQLEGAFHN